MGLAYKQNNNAVGFAILPHAISGLKELRHLNLKKNYPWDLCGTAVSSVPLALQGLCRLEYLNLSKNTMGAEAAAIMARAIMQLTCLTHLDISGTRLIDGYGDEGPACALFTDTTLIERLNPRGVRCVSEALQCLSRLTYINIHATVFGVEGATRITKALSALPCLRGLVIGHCDRYLGKEAGSIMASAIQGFTRLNQLDCSLGSLGQTGG